MASPSHRVAVKLAAVPLTPAEYEASAWPTLARFFVRHLSPESATAPPATVPHDRCVELYRVVYQCCNDGFARRLLDDFFALCNCHFGAIAEALVAARESGCAAVVEVAATQTARMAALADCIPPVFRYLDRVFMRPKRGTTVADAFRAQFDACVFGRAGNGDVLFGILRAAGAGAADVPPELVSACVQSLFRMEKAYAQHAPALFAQLAPASSSDETRMTSLSLGPASYRDIQKARLQAAASSNSRKRRPSSPELLGDMRGRMCGDETSHADIPDDVWPEAPEDLPAAAMDEG